LLVSERDGWYEIRAEVDAEYRDGAKGEWNVGEDEEKERSDLWDVARQRVRDRLL